MRAVNTTRRPRAALLWAVTAFALAQLVLVVLLNTSWRARDPEYGRRLRSLRARMAERAPAGPLVLLLGSSRVATGVRPDLLAANRPTASGGPVVFNYALCNSGPVMELLCLRRLLADGVRPDCVFVEVWWVLAYGDAEAQMARINPERLGWRDRSALRGYYRDPRPASRRWAGEALPCLSYRAQLLGEVAPSWAAGDGRRRNVECDGVDGWGWLRHPDFGHRLGAWADHVRADYLALSPCFTLSDDSRRAVGELLALCREERITAVLLAMPDPWLADYQPAVRAGMDAFLRDLSRENDVPLIDTRGWMPQDNFVDDIHLTHDAAAAFTERFGREVLPSYLGGGSRPEPEPSGAQVSACR